ncbi:hypothetical protein TM49_20340 [Martelella endophytica]|uniref:Uncharacterized protein n=1 Tax=Martelella endophytica TaxID=1486262 RepID=A0A0D5LUR3_MAREN|nr:hypothetical protein TM49_20340 [Martelella endophytica]
MVFFGCSTAAKAEDVTQKTVYTLSFSGIKIADAAFNTEVKDGDYTIQADIKAAGIGSLFSDIAVGVKAQGVWQNGGPESRHFFLKYRDGDYARDYAAEFSRKRVIGSTITPDPGPRGDDWVDVRSSHLRNVIDPISALLLPPSPNPCQGSIAIFDGETRLNLELASAGSRPFSTKGFSGRAVGCAIRFKPIAGYERKDDDIEYLANSRELVVWFALNDELNIYAPVMAKIPLKIGQLTIYASQFGV